MDLQLAGKTAVVTAAGGGIGGAVVRTLVAEGARVLGADRAVTPKLKAIATHTVEADLTTAEGAELLRQAAQTELGHVDVLVNGVGGLAGLPVADLPDLDDDTWQRAFDLNFFSMVRITRALQPLVRESVVNISSISGRQAWGSPQWYGSAKAAMTHLSKGLADELAPHGIRVNAVSPGLIKTPLWHEYGPRHEFRGNENTDDFLNGLPDAARVALNRWGTAQEVANLVVFLASPAASYITGADYLIDGGTEKTVR
jgi:NAD(P)-dependent dehydrogenase (short-subunit alcohol dehydrogenase family)